MGQPGSASSSAMKQRLTLLPVCLALVGLLAACNSQPRVVNFATWKQQPQTVQPQVRVTPVRLDLPFAPGSDALSDEDETALNDFLSHSGIAGGATVDLAVAPAAAGD